MLLAIADCADDLGRAYPSIRYIGRKARLSERATQAAVKELVELGELRIDPNDGPMGCNVYWVLTREMSAQDPRKNSTPAEIAPPQFLPKPPAESAPKPSVEPSSTTPPTPSGRNATGGRGDFRGSGQKPQSVEAKRLAAIFGRADGVSWDRREVEAFRVLCPMDPEELGLIERYYHTNAGLPENPARCRRELYTLLTNWRGEIDKAMAWAKRNPAKRKPIADPEPEGFREWFKKEYPRADPMHPWRTVPDEVKQHWRQQQ